MHSQAPISFNGLNLVAQAGRHGPGNNEVKQYLYFFALRNGRYTLTQTMHMERGGTYATSNIGSYFTQLHISYNGNAVLATGHNKEQNWYGAQRLYMKNDDTGEYYLHTDFSTDNGNTPSGTRAWTRFGLGSGLSADGRYVAIGGHHMRNNEHNIVVYEYNEKQNYYLYKMQYNDNSMHLPGDSCLLYTSPSPRDQRGSRMPSSA